MRPSKKKAQCAAATCVRRGSQAFDTSSPRKMLRKRRPAGDMLEKTAAKNLGAALSHYLDPRHMPKSTWAHGLGMQIQ